MILTLGLALAKPAIPGKAADDGCEASALQTALDAPDFGVFAAGIVAACPGFAPEVGAWLQSRVEGTRSPRAQMACPRAKGDLKRAVSPGFAARMKGVAKSCKIRGWKVERSVGPGALLLGWTLAERLAEGGIDRKLATEVGHRLAGIEGGRMPGRYGSIASVADRVVLPVAENITMPLPIDTGEERVWIVDGRARAAKMDDASAGGWLAVLPPEGTLEENAPVHAIRFDPFEGDAALRLAVSPTEVRLAYGAAGSEVEARGPEAAVAVENAREDVLRAQEYGGETVPDRVWVQPVDNVTVARLVEVVDLLFHDDGTPRFESLTLGSDGTLAEWPERVDGSGL